MQKSQNNMPNDGGDTILVWLIVACICLLLVAVGFMLFSCASPTHIPNLNSNERCKDGLVYIWKNYGDVGEGWYIKIIDGKAVECKGWEG